MAINKKQRYQRGFTLVEILIVVVILAVLAAMVVPRFIDKSENGFIADAQNLLGSLRSSYVMVTDSDLTTPLALANADLASTSAMATWGMQPLAAAPTRFSFACTAAGSCTATRTGGSYTGGTINLSESGTWTCGGGRYVLQSDPRKGCKPV
ncbi:MAG TPA: prepilin-type N-terminal cleavage/methylation domain-containing protein [Candidatus Omnitrophota bacterium]|nr:prepilin-type N-terminal cleavage/methylation domain-containing protein [Candidatus Omnitrophota bacterium]HRY91554.1 prepilin-type N-terminal cleavage/methylation domain-containing protein [Candidatus Gracilibacteria bacterium]